tara:strand:+ start:56 stop:253 length:198 start_codon:yes stop_codon:yes gene_type:complete
MDKETLKELFCTNILNDEMKVKVCTRINESVNIPFISERTEQVVFESIWEIFETAFREQLESTTE